MFIFPSLKFKAIILIAQAFLIFSLLVQFNLAGVIKKRDLAEIESSFINSSLSQNETAFKESQLSPTILSAVANENVSTKLKLQPANVNFSTETSKELSYNEIVLNEAQKMVDKELKSSLQNHTSTASRDHDEQKAGTEEKLKDSEQNEKYRNSNQNPNSFSNIEDNSKLEEKKNKVDSLIDPLVQGKIEQNLQNISQKLSEKLKFLNPIITTTQTSINVIQEEEQLQKEKELKIEEKSDSSKLTSRFKQLEISTADLAKAAKEEENNSNSFENSLKFLEEKPRPPSQILNELITETKTNSTTLKSDNDIEFGASKLRTTIQNENSVETNQHSETKTENTTASEHIENLNSVKELQKSPETTPFTVNKTSSFVPSLITEEDNKIGTFKTSLKVSVENQTLVEDPKTTESTDTATIISEYVNKSLSSGSSNNLEAEHMKNLTKLPDLSDSFRQEEHSNSISDGLDREELLKFSKLEPIPETTSQPMDIIETTFLEANKLEYARPMSRESEDELKVKDGVVNLKESATVQSNNENEIEIYTTPKSILHSTKDSVNKDTEVTTKVNIIENSKGKESGEQTTEENVKNNSEEKVTFKENMEESTYGSSKLNEKKAKFINDNSTNVQHLNLPNTAESWNLASMKPIFKENVTIDTVHKHNITNEVKEEPQKNNSFSINSISEKNLLDWSKVMKDKELFTTIRNQNIQQIEKEEETTGHILANDKNMFSTTEWEKHREVVDITTSRPQQTLTQPSIQSREDMPKIKPLIEHDFTNPTIMPNSTILSHSSDNSNKEDKHTNSMNNHIETFTSLKETGNTASQKSQSQLNNNPSVNIEPNLSVTNLTSNHTQQNANDAENTTTTGKQYVNADADVDVTVETNKAGERTTATEATDGIVDMTTTLEQNSIELTTLSTLEARKQNASQSNVVTQQQINNNEISEDSLKDELEKTFKQEVNNKFENIELETNITTTSEIPITTYRPTDLAITSTLTSSIPKPSFEQEVDQNGNNEIQPQLTKNNVGQKQSITAFEGGNNSKPIESHLSELEIETTTLETITTTNKIAENNTTTTLMENSTSSSKDETTNEQITKLDVTTQATTPKSEDDENEEVTTIGSPVIETKLEKETKEEILTTTADTITTAVTPKTPVVVVIETQGTVTHNESSTVESIIDEDRNKIDMQTNQGSDNTEEFTQTPKEIHETDNNNETTTISAYPINTTTMKTEDETIKINLLDDTTTSTSTTSQPLFTTTITESPTTTTTITPLPITTKIEEIYKVIHTTTTETTPTTTSQIVTEPEEFFSSSTTSNMIPTTASTVLSTKMIDTADIGKSLPTLTSIMGGNSGNMYPKNTEASGETDVNVIIAITVSVIGVVALILLVGFLYLMRKRQKQTSYSQRCRPVSLDEYTIDNASVGGSMRKTSALRSSKRTYGNLAFDDPSLRHNAMGVHELAKFAQEKLRIFEEFRDVPQITSRLDEVPLGCEEKNRYANVLPLPETRVILQRLNNDDKTEYINANYVTGPKDPPNYFIACQAPLDTTVEDFWRMIWEQQSRVIIQATDLIENGVEKCAEYLPPSVTLDNHSTFGDFQITLQNRDIKDKYAISTILLKHVTENATRELTHYWYKWPEVGVPAEEAPIIAMLLEARSSLISYAIEQANEDKEKSSMVTLKSAEEGTASANGTIPSPSEDSKGSSANGSNSEINGNISMVNIKKTARNQGPLTIHCSPGTGRTGTIIACDIAIRSLETPKRTVDIPQIVYYVRRGRASAVLTKEQYEFIYKVANMYAAKITNPTNYN